MKKLDVTVQCMAVYNSSIDVPDGLTIDEAIEYAKKHIDNIALGVLEYVPGSDVLDKENCDFAPELTEYQGVNIGTWLAHHKNSCKTDTPSKEGSSLPMQESTLESNAK